MSINIVDFSRLHSFILKVTIRDQEIKEAILYFNMDPLPTIDHFKNALKKSYYEMAFELHPDKQGSKEDFQKLSGVYNFLLDILKNDPKRIEVFLKIHENKKKGFQSSVSGFNNYKKAMQDYSGALEEYFQKVRVVNLNPSDPDYIELCERMKGIKKELFSVIKLNPAEAWVPDCIEKIHRINVWLKSQNYSSR